MKNILFLALFIFPCFAFSQSRPNLYEASSYKKDSCTWTKPPVATSWCRRGFVVGQAECRLNIGGKARIRTACPEPVSRGGGWKCLEWANTLREDICTNFEEDSAMRRMNQGTTPQRGR